MFKSLFIFILIYLFQTNIYSQENKTITLRYADSLVGSVINNEQVRELVGKVDLVQGNLNLKCDKARQYFLSNKIELFGNIVITQDTLKLYANEGVYFGEDRIAVCKNGLKISDGHVNLAANKGSYNANQRMASFEEKVKVEDSTSTIYSDFLTYYRNEKKIRCTRNVKLFSKDKKTIVFGDSLENNQKTNLTRIYPNPELRQIDTTYFRSNVKGKPDSVIVDTLFIKSKMLESKKDSSKTSFYAYDSVRVYRKELAINCGIVFYNTKDSIFVLRQSPVMWYSTNQINADSLDIMLENANLSKINAKGSSFVLSQFDTTRKNRYNQISGETIKIFFKENKIDTIISENQAMALYYVLDGNRANGINRQSGDKVIMLFEDGKLTEVKFQNGIEGTYFPENMVMNRESEYNLPNYKIFSNKPTREIFRK